MGRGGRILAQSAQGSVTLALPALFGMGKQVNVSEPTSYLRETVALSTLHR